jgi:asparagine synthase (glutamine-hydrolysing)
LPKIILGLDEPIGDPTAIPLYFLSEFVASQGEKVVLSGEGADEVFGGYTTYFEPAAFRRYQELPWVVRSLAKKLFPQKVKRFSLNLEERYLGVGGLLRNDQKQGIYSLSMLHGLREGERCFLEQEYLKDGRYSEEDRMLKFDLCSWLPEDALMKSDKMTMQYSLEMRLPYLDHELVELVYSLPFEYKVSQNITKSILRSALEPHLPKEISSRSKNGFPVPITAWLTYELKNEIREVLLDPGSSLRQFILPQKVEELFQSEISHRSARLIWALYTLEEYLYLTIPAAMNPECSDGELTLSIKSFS